MKRNKKYFLQQYLHVSPDHGGIGFVDIEKIFLSISIIPIIIESNILLFRIMKLIKLVFQIKSNDTLYFIFPVYAKMHVFFLKLLVFKKCNIICIYGDSDGLRHNNEKMLNNELKLISLFKIVIVHNEIMASWMKIHFPQKRIYSLCLFDYLTPMQKNIKRAKSFEIVFAGNLLKSHFINYVENLNTLNPLVKFNLYGKILNINKINCIYKGFFSPYDTPQNLHGSFGLIWDGSSLEKCEGNYGNYLIYSTPHKLSVYILAGLPIILHEDAAMASFVTENNIGFCISSLFEIEEKINALTEHQYQQMIENLKPIAEKISTGYYLQTAIENTINIH